MGTVDSRYAASEGRKVSAPSWNPVELLKHPNWITLLVLLVALAVIVLVVFLAYRIATRGRRTRYCGKRRGCLLYTSSSGWDGRH